MTQPVSFVDFPHYPFLAQDRHACGMSNQEYVARPQWQSYEDLSKSEKKSISLLEKHKRQFADKRRLAREEE